MQSRNRPAMPTDRRSRARGRAFAPFQAGALGEKWRTAASPRSLVKIGPRRPLRRAHYLPRLRRGLFLALGEVAVGVAADLGLGRAFDELALGVLARRR